MTLSSFALRTAGIACLAWGTLVPAMAGAAGPRLPGVSAPGAAATPAPAVTINPDTPIQGFPINGIAAIVENKVITLDEIRRDLSLEEPGLMQIVVQRGGTQKDFEDARAQTIDNIIQRIIDRELVIKEFRKVKPNQPIRQIPATFIDARISGLIADQFESDRSKYVKYLAERQMTSAEHRKEVEEDIIFQFMRQQQRRSMSMVSPVKIETYYKENLESFRQPDRTRMRLLQIKGGNGQTPDTLRTRLNAIAAEFKAGKKFPDLVVEHSEDLTTKGKGGDYGFQIKGELKDEFSVPLFALKAGEITEPILASDGNGYLLFAEEREYEGIPPLDKVRGQIEQALVTQMSAQDEQRWLERLRRTGFVRLMF